MVEARSRAAIHFVVLSVAAVHLDHGGLVTIKVGIRAGATECLGPVSGESLDMLGVEAVAEGMADYVVGHHPTMPGVGKDKDCDDDDDDHGHGNGNGNGHGNDEGHGHD